MLGETIFNIRIDKDSTLNVIWNGKVIESTKWGMWIGEYIEAESIEEFDHVSRKTAKFKGFTPHVLTRLIKLYIKNRKI